MAPRRPTKRLRERPWPYFVGALTLVVLSGVVVALLAPVLNRDNPDRAKVGDCVEEVGSDKVKIIACDDAKADFRVVARVENQASWEATANACLQYRDQGVVSSFWQGERDGTGYVLCLANVAG